MPQVPIAIVGVSALFPGSTDAQGFFRDILAGRGPTTAQQTPQEEQQGKQQDEEQADDPSTAFHGASSVKGDQGMGLGRWLNGEA